MVTSTPVKPTAHDTRFHFGPDTNGQDPVCDLRVFARRRGSMCRVDVVIATELDDNPGMSITNAAEELHAAVARLGYVTEPFILVEHYPRNRYGSTHPETFAQIAVRDDKARWHGLTRQEVEAMIAGPLE